LWITPRALIHRLERGDIVAVYVENRPPSAREKRTLQNDFALSDRLKIPVMTLHGDVAAELIRYARENGITQIVMGHSDRSRWKELTQGSIINRLARELRMVDILIVASPPEEAA
jgi:two-component system, OmpR family, sensor histidine kinase KdpD